MTKFLTKNFDAIEAYMIRVGWMVSSIGLFVAVTVWQHSLSTWLFNISFGFSLMSAILAMLALWSYNFKRSSYPKDHFQEGKRSFSNV